MRGPTITSLISINLTVETDDATTALRAWETPTRVAAGLGFDGTHAELSIDRVTYTDDDDDDLTPASDQHDTDERNE